jgi:hypothetical protein
MTKSLEHAECRQIYLLGVMDDDGNSWEELISTRDMGGILSFLADHRLELMYAKGMTESGAQKWQNDSVNLKECG